MPLRYRHIGFALSVSSQWIMAFLTVYAGPIAIADKSVGWKTWIWFLVFTIIAAPFGKATSQQIVLHSPLTLSSILLLPRDSRKIAGRDRFDLHVFSS